MTFPVPFSGITKAIHLLPYEIAIVLNHFGHHCGKGHRHNIAVQFDGNIIHVSDGAVECIQEVLGR